MVRGGGLKIRLLIALGIAAFALISYYMKPGDVNETTGKPERVAMTEEAQEIQLGLQAAPQMVGQHGGPSRSAGDQDIVNRVGWRLLEALNKNLEEYNQQNPGAKRKNPYLQAFRFTLLADKQTVNAFALPGGQVFVTHALYDQLKTEGQLAGVLGHEIGHVLMRHGNKRMAKQGPLPRPGRSGRRFGWRWSRRTDGADDCLSAEHEIWSRPRTRIGRLGCQAI